MAGLGQSLCLIFPIWKMGPVALRGGREDCPLSREPRVREDTPWLLFGWHFCTRNRASKHTVTPTPQPRSSSAEGGVAVQGGPIPGGFCPPPRLGQCAPLIGSTSPPGSFARVAWDTLDKPLGHMCMFLSVCVGHVLMLPICVGPHVCVSCLCVCLSRGLPRTFCVWAAWGKVTLTPYHGCPPPSPARWETRR